MKKNSLLKRMLAGAAALALAIAVQAQTQFHDVEANGAIGPVKQMTISVMGNSETINFSKEGKIEKEEITDAVYDENGYMQTCKAVIQGMQATVKYIWKDGRLESQAVDIMGQGVSTKYTYNEKGAPASETMSMMGQDMSSNYSDYKYDDHGNWISRTGTLMGQSMTQTRTIEYYE